jgi:hypothetical protein
MKPITCLLAFFLGASSFASAQKMAPQREPDYSKPKLFLSMPLIVPVVLQQLDSLLLQPEGKPVTLHLGAGYEFQGQVVSRSNGFDKTLSSMVVRMTGPAALTLSLSRRTTDVGAQYTGRLISYEHGDALELVADAGGYHFEKRGLYDLLSN